MKLEFSRQVFEKYSSIKFNESPPVGGGLFHAKRRRDMKLTVAFHSFTDVPKPTMCRANTGHCYSFSTVHPSSNPRSKYPSFSGALSWILAKWRWQNFNILFMFNSIRKGSVRICPRCHTRPWPVHLQQWGGYDGAGNVRTCEYPSDWVYSLLYTVWQKLGGDKCCEE